MAGIFVKRLISGLVLLWTSTALVFFLMHASGGDIARSLLGSQVTQDVVDAKAHQLGLDQPVIIQYLNWLTSAVTGDLGVSWTMGTPVSTVIFSRTAVTLSIVISSLIITSILAVIIGVVSARKRGWLDQTLQGASILGTALPSFWIALVLVTTFAINIKLFPATGYVAFEKNPVGWVMSLVLPVAAISVAGISGVAMQVRSAVIDLGQKEFVRTLVSHGLTHRRILFRHILRNAAGPSLVILSLQFVGMLSGAVVIEKVFSMPGLGILAVSATSVSDVPIVMGVMTIMVALVVLVNLIVDLTSAWLNPKVRIR